MKFKDKPWTHYSSKEQSNIIYGESRVCLKCNQPAITVVDTTSPPKHYRNKRGELTVVAHESIIHPLQLCYYHLHKELGNFDIRRGGIYRTV